MDEVHGHDIDSAVADRKRTDRRYVEPVGRRLRIAAGACVGLVLLGLGLGIALDEPRPVGVPGPEAEALARRVEQATRLDAWERTGAIAFDFGGHRYLWDRRRELVEVRFDDLVVKLPLRGGRAVILRRGRPVTRQAERVEARERAVRYFVNDSFWLNPLAKLREPGVVLSAATHRGRRGLLVSYTSGGITPGDAYFWTLGPDGAPERWAMWVSVLPIGGLETTWEGWTTLPTGARIALRHANGAGAPPSFVLDDAWRIERELADRTLRPHPGVRAA